MRLFFLCSLCCISAFAWQDSRAPRLIAEWEPAQGTMIAWPLYIPCELVVALAEDDELYVLVANEAQETDARAAFMDWDVRMSAVTFIQTSTESPWTRDYGAHQIFNAQGQWTIVDSVYIDTPGFPLNPEPVGRGQKLDYHRNYPGDDRTNEDLAKFFKAPLDMTDAMLTGGNFLTDGLGTAFVTRAMMDENNVLFSDTELRELVKQLMGIHRIVVLHNTESYGIQHIDCFFKILDPETLLVKEVPKGHAEYEPIERNLEILRGLKSAYGTPYRIHRIACPPYFEGRNYKTKEREEWVPAYTNSLILNKKVFVPMFGTDSDAEALATFRRLLPGYKVMGFSYAYWWPYDGLHCRTRALFDRNMLTLFQTPPKAASEHAISLDVYVEDHQSADLEASAVCVYYRKANEVTWTKQSLKRSGIMRWTGEIPAASEGRWEYYLEAEGSDGKRETLPRTAPQGLFHL